MVHTEGVSQYTIHEAKAKLSHLLNQAETGKDVLIVRRGHAPVRLVKVDVPASRTLGSRSGELIYSDAALEPMTDAHAEAFWKGDY